MRYWIDRFPRLLSHSYHALQSCCNEPIFSKYYPQNYAFSKPNYFYEETEDFKPFDGGQKPRDNRDSPKRYNQEYRYKPMNYPNFVMDRKPTSKLPNSAIMNMGDSANYTRTNNKKGSYNFHRVWLNEPNNFKTEQNDTSQSEEIGRPTENAESPFVRDESSAESIDKNEPQKKTENIDVKYKEKIAENNESTAIDNNVKSADQEFPNTSTEEKLEKGEKRKSFERNEQHGQMKRDENQKHNEKNPSHKKKAKAEAASNKDPTDVDEEGFVKVRYRGHNNTKKQKSNEHVNWIIPGRENK